MKKSSINRQMTVVKRNHELSLYRDQFHNTSSIELPTKMKAHANVSARFTAHRISSRDMVIPADVGRVILRRASIS